MTPTVILIPGHGLKADFDPGAQVDLDDDGRQEEWESEARLVRGGMTYRVAEALGWRGWDPHVLDAREYSERAVEAARIARDADLCAILYLHLDSHDGGNRGLVGHLAESGLGASLAEHLAEGLRGDMPTQAGPIHVESYGPNETAQWKRNGRAVLWPSWATPSWCAGALLEPLRIQALAGVGWTEMDRWLSAVASGVVAGLDTWAAECVARGIPRRRSA